MRLLSGRVATTHVDAHGEAFHPDVLYDAANGLHDTAMPCLLEHDWRQYIGRSVAARIERLQDGHVALVQDFEVFERSDPVPVFEFSKLLPPVADEDTLPSVLIDRNHADPSDTDLFNTIDAFCPSSGSELKRKAEVVSVSSLLIAFGLFATASVTGGFFKAIGADAYASIKKAIVAWSTQPANECRVLEFVVVCDDIDHAYQVRVYAHAAALGEGEASMDRLWANLRDELATINAKANKIRHVIFEYDRSGLQLLQRVRQDGVPLDMTKLPSTDTTKLGLSAAGIAHNPGPSPS